MNFEFLTAPVAQAIGWALLHLLWQGALVAGVLAATLALLARRSANARYVAACFALALLPVLAVITAVRSYEPAAADVATSMPTASDPLPAMTQAIGNATVARNATLGETFRSVMGSARDYLPQIVLAWLVGVTFLSIRLFVSWLKVTRLARRSALSASAASLQMLARISEAMGLRRAVTLLESAAVEVPTVIGWMRPVILLPMSTLSGLSPAQIEMILAHELAHIRRHDFFVNLLQALVETLMFYHPAVWWMSARVRAERENCCDDLAVAVCGSALQYARALTRLEELRATKLEMAMAANGGSLIGRIRRLVSTPTDVTGSTSRWAAGAAVLSIVIILLALPSLPAMARNDQDEEPIPVVAPTAAETTVHVKALAPKARMAADIQVNVDDVDDADDIDDIDVDFDVPDSDIIPPGAPAPPAPAAAPAPALAPPGFPAPRPALAPMAMAAGGAMFDADFDVDVDFANDDDEDDREKDRAREDRRRSRGRKFGEGDKLTVDELVALKNAGVTPEYIRDIRAAGLGDLTLGDIHSLRIQGVTAEWIRDLRASGVPVNNASEAVSMRIHGVTGAFVKALADAGYKNLSAKELSSLRIHGVNPEFIRNLASLGYTNLSAKDLTSLAIHGVNSSYIRELANAGYPKLTVKELTSMKIHSVDADFVKAIADAGYKNVPVNQITALRIHGVTPSFIKQLAAAGYTNLSVREILRLAQMGVNADFIREMSQYKTDKK